jgi:hypothetical protein
VVIFLGPDSDKIIAISWFSQSRGKLYSWLMRDRD